MTTKIVEELAPDAQVVPKARWQLLRDTYVCRASLRQEASGRIVATAVRLPGVVNYGNSESEALAGLMETFRHAMSQKLASGSKLAEFDPSASHRSTLVVVPKPPSVRDIDDAYEDDELTDEQLAALHLQRSSNPASPTIPLVKVPR